MTPITCPECKWQGTAADLEVKMWCDLCPECRVILYHGSKRPGYDYAREHVDSLTYDEGGEG